MKLKGFLKQLFVLFVEHLLMNCNLILIWSWCSFNVIWLALRQLNKTHALLFPRSEVVECLSIKVRDAVLTDRSHAVSKRCRRQLSFELLQRVRGNLFPSILFCWCWFCFSFHIFFLKLSTYGGFFCFVFQSETIKLDPKLQTECELDIRKFCPNVTPGNSNVRLDDTFIVWLHLCIRNL